MTIISTIITNNYIVHASDSKITNFSLETGKTETSQNSRKTKIIKAEKFRGMISFWGLAKYRIGEKDFYMIDWLNTKVAQAQKEMSPENFALKVRDDLNKEFKTLKCNNPLEKGLGIHFSACELINGRWIPEMFLIWNYKDGTYNEITPEWSCTRTTCYFVEGQGIGEKIDSQEFRVKFLSFLNEEKMAFFNNGDWMMFNPIANGIIGTINQAPHTLFSEGIHNPNYLIILAQKPIEIVSDIQKKLFKRENVKVGGKPHNLIYDIKMNQYFSTTGDN